MWTENINLLILDVLVARKWLHQIQFGKCICRSLMLWRPNLELILLLLAVVQYDFFSLNIVFLFKPKMLTAGGILSSCGQAGDSILYILVFLYIKSVCKNVFGLLMYANFHVHAWFFILCFTFSHLEGFHLSSRRSLNPHLSSQRPLMMSAN